MEYVGRVGLSQHPGSILHGGSYLISWWGIIRNFVMPCLERSKAAGRERTFIHCRLMQDCFIFPAPPYFFMSEHGGQLRQSPRVHASHALHLTRLRRIADVCVSTPLSSFLSKLSTLLPLILPLLLPLPHPLPLPLPLLLLLLLLLLPLPLLLLLLLLLSQKGFIFLNYKK